MISYIDNANPKKFKIPIHCEYFIHRTVGACVCV